MLMIRQEFLPKGHPNRPGFYMEPKGLLIHTTNNWRPGAGDELHGKYLLDTVNKVWHVTVDKDSATQHLPFNENGWHAGDGKTGHYNRNWIGLEIACEAVKEGQPLDKATYDNAVDVASQIMMMHGWYTAEYIAPHSVVYGKNCPHNTLFDFNKFEKDVLALIQKRLEAAKPKPGKTPFPDVPSGKWSEDFIKRVVDLKIMTGLPDGRFDPNGVLTREQAAVIAVRIYDLIMKEVQK